MNQKEINPYIRRALFSTLIAPFNINDRIILDYEIIYVSGGKCSITIDGKEFLCQEGDVVLLRPGITHRFDCLDNSNFVQPHIHFDPVYSQDSEARFVCFKSWQIMSEQEQRLVHKDILSAAIPNVFIPADPEGFRKLFYKIITLYQKKEYNYELLCKAAMLELMNRMLAQFETPRLAKPGSDVDLMFAVKEFLDSNYTSALSLLFLAEQFAVNKFTLMRKFKAVYRQSIMEYYRQKRLGYAKQLLETTDFSVQDIGEMLNFSDVYSFSRFFKENTGCSPSAYRKEKRREKNAHP